MTYRHKRSTLKIPDRILILCEGERTEPIYFKAIKADKMKVNKLSGLRIELHKTKKNTAKELVEEAISLKHEAIRERNAYNEVWVVVDRDNYTKHHEAFTRANATNIKIAFSSTCFEFWLLLHFEYSARPFHDCDSVIAKLKTHIPNYEKDVDYYEELLKPNINIAIDNGKKIIAHCNQTGQGNIWEHNPYTDVGILVEKLLSL